MGASKTVAEKIYSVLAVAFGLFWLAFLLLRPAVCAALWPGNESSGAVYPLLAIWLLVTGLYGWLLDRLQTRLAGALYGALLFVLCALPRLAVLLLQYYIPTNDFANYLLYGQCFVQGDFAPAADLIANYYQMPKMGGLVVFNGLLMELFGASLTGLQVANILLTSGICLALYHLVKPLHGQAAWVAALLWMVYPSNIVSTQIPTNHHGAVLFFLLGLLCYQRLLQCERWAQIVLLAVAAGVCLTVSNLIHPSVIVVQLSILCFTVLAVGYYAQRRHLLCRQNQKLLAAVLLIFLTGSLTQQLCMEQLQAKQVITDDKEISVLFKLVLGFNRERGGSYVEDDYVYIRSLPEAEQAQACLELLRQRLERPLDAVLFMLQKTDAAWFQRDGYFYWYQEGALLEYSTRMATLSEAEQRQYWRAVRWVDGAQALDVVVVRLVYWLAVLGLWTGGRRFTAAGEQVLLFLPLGWIAVIMLTEMQSRYRYPAMPAFFFLAALGVCALGRYILAWRRQRGILDRKAGSSRG